VLGRVKGPRATRAGALGAFVERAGDVGALLRGEGEHAPDAERVPWSSLCALAFTSALLHGAVVGSFGMRPMQSAFSAVKLPLLLALSTLLCLPNFYAVNAVLGLRDDFRAALRAVLAAQATVAVALLSEAPLVLLAYASTTSYPFAIVANGACFALASACGQVVLGRHYRRLVEKDPRHALARRAWLVLYVFVAIQLAWMLRPFVGDPGLATRFFRAEPFSNAYVVVLRTVAALFSGRG